MAVGDATSECVQNLDDYALIVSQADVVSVGMRIPQPHKTTLSSTSPTVELTAVHEDH